MSDTRAYVRLQSRRFIRSADWFWLGFVSIYAFIAGRVWSLEFFALGVYLVAIAGFFRELPGRGDTGFNSMQAYLISRPVGRGRVHGWRKATDLVWVVTILAMFGIGWWRKSAQPIDPADLVCRTDGAGMFETPLAWCFVLSTAGVMAFSEVLSPFVTVPRQRRTIADSIFIGLAHLALWGTFIAYILVSLELVEPPTRYVSLAPWIAAGLTAFFVLHATRIWRRYDFVTSRSQTHSWTHGLRGLLGGGTEWNHRRKGHGLRGLMMPVYIYPPLGWLLYVGFNWSLMIRRGRSVWETMGWFSTILTLIPIALIGIFTWSFFYAGGRTSTYALSRPASRGALARANSMAFGLNGLLVVILLAGFGWYIEGHLGPGALLLPWAWLLFLYAGSFAMAQSFASPVLNSPLGLVGGIILISATAMAIVVDKSPENLSTPFASILCTAAALALATVVIVVADRHTRNADIG